MEKIREITSENIDELIVTEIREGLYAFLTYIKSPYNNHPSVKNCAYEELLDSIDISSLDPNTEIPENVDYLELLKLLGLPIEEMRNYVQQGLSYEGFDFEDIQAYLDNNELTFNYSALHYIVYSLSQMSRKNLPLVDNLYSFKDVISILNSLKNATIDLEELKDYFLPPNKKKQLEEKEKQDSTFNNIIDESKNTLTDKSNEYNGLKKELESAKVEIEKLREKLNGIENNFKSLS